MFFLEGFRTFNFNEGVPFVSFTSNGVTFNKAVVMKLNYPAHVLLLINDEEKQIAIVACDEHEANSAQFFKPKKNNVLSVRWNGRDLLNTIQSLMGWDLGRESYKVEGVFLRDEQAMLFDLNNAAKL